MKKVVRTVYDAIKGTIDIWVAADALRLAAALSYYTIFSIGPLLILAIAIAGIFFGQEMAHSQVMHQVDAMFGTSAADALRTVLAGVMDKSSTRTASVVGVGLLVIGAMSAFLELKTDLNRIFEGKDAEEKSGWREIVGARLLSFVMILAIGILLVLSLLTSAVIAFASKYLQSHLSFPVELLQWVDPVFSFVVMTVLFATIFRILPDTKMRWRDVWLGAAITSVLFGIGKFVVGYYLGKSAVASAYGASASLVVLLLWTYYSSAILFFGAASIRYLMLDPTKKK